MLAVPRLWPGETVVCIASGPSLTREDVESVRGKARVIAVNDAYRLAPWADVLYAFDWHWWEHHNGVPSFHGLKYSIKADIALNPEWGVTQLKLGEEYGLAEDPTTLNHGKNSGYQALNLAVHLGASRILLLGYDMQLGPNGKRHWFGEHPQPIMRHYTGMPFDYWCTCFESLVVPLQAKGVEVVNCTRTTALKHFPHVALEDALELSHA